MSQEFWDHFNNLEESTTLHSPLSHPYLSVNSIRRPILALPTAHTKPVRKATPLWFSKTITGTLTKQEAEQQQEQLRITIQMYALRTGYSEVELLRLLDRASGDFHLLDKHLETGCSKFLWDDFEDELLLQAKKDPNSEIDVLLRSKPLKEREFRQKYLNI